MWYHLSHARVLKLEKLVSMHIYIYFFFLFFSESCNERWSKAKGGNNKCPQCNAPARKIDIRNIYTKAIKAINTKECDNALADLEKEKGA